MSALDRLLKRPPWATRPTREQIVGAALQELHRKMAKFRKRTPNPPQEDTSK